MGELALPYELGGRAAHDTVPRRRDVELRFSDDIPTNEHGIVVLENPRPCADNCHLRGFDEQCFIDLDHLHHSGAYYEYDGNLARRFRAEDALTRWVYRCRHEAKHQLYPYNVPVPRPEVMKRAVTESRLLRDIESNFRERSIIEASLERDRMKPKSREKAKRRLDKKFKERKKLIRSIDDIEILPQEIVTGALLLALPGHAEDRLMRNPHYMLPGTIRRDDVFTAWRIADEILARREVGRALALGRQLDADFEQALNRAA